MIYTIKKASFSYGNHKVIEIDSLSINEGKIYVLFGPNGSGKTTLLKILNGLLKIKKGIINFEGISIDADNFKQIRNNTVYVHQNPFLLTGTVYDNVAYGLKLRKKDKNTINKTVKEILEFIGLSGFENRKSKNLSDGEAKRVAIARALTLSPKVLLLDEPTANIDRESVDKIYGILKKINEINKTTIIISSHDTMFNKKIADEILYMENGSILYPKPFLCTQEKVSQNYEGNSYLGIIQ